MKAKNINMSLKAWITFIFFSEKFTIRANVENRSYPYST